MDSLIRLRQINKNEVSGYALDVLRSYLITGTGLLTNTGSLTGIFYPLKSNPSGYSVSGDFVLRTETGGFIDSNQQASNNNGLFNLFNALFYYKSNPSGYIQKSVSDITYLKFTGNNSSDFLIYDNDLSLKSLEWKPAKSFFLRGINGAVMDLYAYLIPNNPYISGFSVYSNDIKVNGEDVSSYNKIFTDFIGRNSDSANTRLLLSNSIGSTINFAFLNDTSFYIKGKQNAIIDFYDEINSYTKPYISGFHIDAKSLTISGANISTGNQGTGVSFSQLTGTSGALNASIQTVRSLLAQTGDKVTPPLFSPKTIYLTNYYQSYTGKLLTATNNLQGLLNIVSGLGSGNYFVYVGTGNFGTLSALNFNFGNLTFKNEFGPNAASLDFNLSKCQGNIKFIDKIYTTFNLSGCSMDIISEQQHISGSFSAFFDHTGTIDGINSNFLDLNGRNKINLNNSQIDILAVGLSLTGTIYVNINNSKVNVFLGDESLNTSKVKVYDGEIDNRIKLKRASGAPFQSFGDSSLSATYYDHILETGWGGFAYSTNDLYLIRNRTGTVESPDVILTKSSGDNLYYSINNPNGFVNDNSVTIKINSTAILKNNQTSNTSLYLNDTVKSINPLNFKQNEFFYLQGTGTNKNIIDIYGAEPIKPYISGFEINGLSLSVNKYGYKAGIYVFQKVISADQDSNIFSIASDHGAHIFNVMISCSVSGYSVAKSYSVANNFVGSPYVIKHIDTGPDPTNNFNPMFSGIGTTGTLMRIHNSGASGVFFVTLFLGGSSENMLISEY